MTPRILRRLKINEISAVNRAANSGARITLLKRQDQTEGHTMPSREQVTKRAAETCATAAKAFDDYCRTVARDLGCSYSKAVDRTLAQPDSPAARLFQMAKSVPMNAAPSDQTVQGSQELARLRSEHSGKALDRFNAIKDAMRQADPTLSSSEASNRLILARPELWAAAKGDSSNSMNGGSPYADRY